MIGGLEMPNLSLAMEHHEQAQRREEVGEA